MLEAGPLRVGQIGREAGLSQLVLPLAIIGGALAALLLGFAWWADRRRGAPIS